MPAVSALLTALSGADVLLWYAASRAVNCSLPAPLAGILSLSSHDAIVGLSPYRGDNLASFRQLDSLCNVTLNSRASALWTIPLQGAPLWKQQNSQIGAPLGADRTARSGRLSERTEPPDRGASQSGQNRQIGAPLRADRTSRSGRLS